MVYSDLYFTFVVKYILKAFMICLIFMLTTISAEEGRKIMKETVMTNEFLNIV